MSKMHAVEVPQANELNFVEKEIPTPNANQVLIKVHACGVCHSDIYATQALWPGLKLPRVPGHEVVGTIEKLGSAVTKWKIGQRVGIGWSGWHCGQCNPCRHGNFVNCEKHQITGIHYDGGYAEFMLAPVEALAAIPDEISFEEAAPLLCAGITSFNALRHSKARAGDLVAILGIGGLGHLAIQFANKMGFKTVAISKGNDKEALAQKLGAHIFINTEKTNAAIDLQKLGGARVILATAPNSKAMTSLIDGLNYEGELMIVGAPQDQLEIEARKLISYTRTIRGWASGTAIDSEETMKFCALTGIRPMIEKFPLKKAKEALESMLSNRVRFRAVLTNS